MSANQAQPPVGPIAQQLARMQSNAQSPVATQPASPQTKRDWIGFSDKTLWDWLNLSAVLLVPLMIGVFTIATTLQQTQISQRQHDSDQQIAKDSREKDIQLAADQQQATTLKSYLDDMTDLMLNRGLRQSKPDDEVRVVARAKTLTALRALNGDRKGALIQFLYEAKLIGGLLPGPHGPSPSLAIINLDGADLSMARLEGARLGWVDLEGVDLSKADLSKADLGEAYLNRATLFQTNLKEASLEGTHLGFAHLEGAHLEGAYLNLATVGFAHLEGAHLEGAHLNSAHLSQVHLEGAYLQEADLEDVDLRGTDLSGTDLRGADLFRANLTDAKVTKEQLAKTLSLEDATLPDKSKYPSQSYSIPNHTEGQRRSVSSPPF